ncbi:hypothetical protein ACHQM5_004101 [Ranunculus cassubicifolius]
MAPIKIEKSSYVNLTNSLDDDDDDCVILDGDPNKPVTVSANACENSTDELLIVAEKGQVACRDYPHARHLCAQFPFSTSPHKNYCDKCHCYVCDTPAPCGYWGIGVWGGDHCHSNDKDEYWKLQRKSLRTQRASEKGEKLTGIVVSFDKEKGYGFIFPDNGSKNLFFLNSSVSTDCESLKQGEKVEFQIEIGDHGESKVINVRVLHGSFIHEITNRQDNYQCDSGYCGRAGGACGYYNPVQTQYSARDYYRSTDPTLTNSSCGSYTGMETDQPVSHCYYKRTSIRNEYSKNTVEGVYPPGDPQYYNYRETGNFVGGYYNGTGVGYSSGVPGGYHDGGANGNGSELRDGYYGGGRGGGGSGYTFGVPAAYSREHNYYNGGGGVVGGGGVYTLVGSGGPQARNGDNTRHCINRFSLGNTKIS